MLAGASALALVGAHVVVARAEAVAAVPAVAIGVELIGSNVNRSDHQDSLDLCAIEKN